MTAWLLVTQCLVSALLCALLAQAEGLIRDLLARWPGLAASMGPRRRRLQRWWWAYCVLWLLLGGYGALHTVRVLP